MELAVDQDSYQIFNTGDHDSTQKHLQQQGETPLKEGFNETDQQKTDPRCKKHRDVGISAIEDFDTAVKKSSGKKYNGICLKRRKSHINTIPF